MIYLEARIETRHIDSAAYCRSPPLIHRLLVLLYLLHMLKLITNSDKLNLWQSLSSHNINDSGLLHGLKANIATSVAVFSIRFSDPYMLQLLQDWFQVACILQSIHRG